MTLDLPYWFKQRQIKAEELATGTYRVVGPNLSEAILGVRMTEDLKWQAVVRAKADGPEIAASTPTLATAREALAVAFEMYREHFVI